MYWMNYVLFMLLLATLASLCVGIFVFFKGGNLNKKYGNILMRTRVVLQGFTLFAFALMLWMRAS